MCAHGVEIPQHRNPPSAVRGGNIAEQLLADVFCPSVGALTVARPGAFAQRHRIDGRVHGGRGGENQPSYPCFVHSAAEGQSGVYVVVIVFLRASQRFAHRFERGKMHNAVNFVLAEYPLQQFFVTQVAFIKIHLPARDLGHPQEALFA